jgi:hypothetical protein
MIPCAGATVHPSMDRPDSRTTSPEAIAQRDASHMTLPIVATKGQLSAPQRLRSPLQLFFLFTFHFIA